MSPSKEPTNPSTSLSSPDLEKSRDPSLKDNVSATTVIDLEQHQIPSSLYPDPYHLRNGIRTEDQISALPSKNKSTTKRIARYQAKQNIFIEHILKPMEVHTLDAEVKEEAARLPVKIAIHASLAANISLCALQLFAAITSGSLSLIATAVDSLFDIASNSILFFLHKKAGKVDPHKWPVGGSRLETVSNITYAFLMSSVNLVVFVQAIYTFVKKQDDEAIAFHQTAVIAVSVALGVKLLLFLYCLPLRKRNSQVRVLFEDHRNDLWINTFGILMFTGGSKLAWYLDPIGAILIATGITISWSRTIYTEFRQLAGISAPHDFMKLLTYKAATFNEEIKHVDTVRAYHSGPEYFVELDIVMDRDTPLWKAHDISEQLQDQLERLPNVGRAFVHVDYEYTHKPEHRN